MSQQAPTLVFDGDCSICRYWVAYWRELTGERVIYRPFQEAAADFPAIPLQSFQRAIQFFDSDGRVYSGAAATFRVLKHSSGRAAWWWCYAHLPGFAPLSESAYAFFARHRGVLDALTKFLWGPALQAERYALVGWVFLRLFGAIYVAAFASLGVQILGLIGHAGILPVGEYFVALRHARGVSAYWLVPSIFWVNSSDSALLAGTIVGAVLGLLVVVDRWTRPALIGLFALYLSYETAGQDFMSFQWDSLLLEVGFLAIFLTGGSKIVIWLYRWLVFRYLFLAGVVKLLSGDSTWRDLTALEYHFWTQPLPTPIAWYAAQLPHWLLRAATAATLAIELGVAFMIFMPRRLRAAAAGPVLLLQVLILLTGNYNFFNLLTMLLCIFLFDDAALGRVIPRWLKARALSRTPLVSRMATVITAALALIVVPVGVNRIWQTTMRTNLPVLGAVTRALAPLSIVNPYGLFAVMTITRPEIVIEGSADGQVWREYVFHYKPGPLTRSAMWNIPHQPRLDWQMWFAALGGIRENPWIVGLMQRLLEGSPAVLALFEVNPFAIAPPKYVRALLYAYRFSDPRKRAVTHEWWVRRLEGLYFPQVSLDEFERDAIRENARP
ncbi:MAG TPA: lipase maturation factor family protein [Steroidobacteraceae bacterium]|nr:lipase maturation factor family protein [Steroidobacteraceae bacterium]